MTVAGGEANGAATSGLGLYRWLVAAARLRPRAVRRKIPWFPIEGEEATVVGSFVDLRPDDAAAPHYRDPFVVYLMRGAEIWRLAAQVLGKSAGYNKGRSVPFNGPVELNMVPWVAGDLGTTLGVAAGAALAFQDEGSDRVCVCTFGDGTANRGDFHEVLEPGRLLELPSIYVCQNNGWAISQRAASYLPPRSSTAPPATACPAWRSRRQRSRRGALGGVRGGRPGAEVAADRR